MKRIAFYGGSFDPPHNGHLTIAHELTEIFRLDEFIFIPAFHAPHKRDKNPTSALHRYAMLALSTNDGADIKISKMELDAPERPYTFETLARLKTEFSRDRIFFVMGADSWAEITTWRGWETVLTTVDIIVVTRPDYEIEFSHITVEIRENIVDLRGKVRGSNFSVQNLPLETRKIYITDAVQLDISATKIRQNIKENKTDWRELVPLEVAKYIEKYDLYI